MYQAKLATNKASWSLTYFDSLFTETKQAALVS